MKVVLVDCGVHFLKYKVQKFSIFKERTKVEIVSIFKGRKQYNFTPPTIKFWLRAYVPANMYFLYLTLSPLHKIHSSVHLKKFSFMVTTSSSMFC